MGERPAVEMGNKNLRLLQEALVRVAKQGRITAADEVFSVMVGMAKYFPELNYLSDYTDDDALREAIQLQLDTRPQAFVDELIALLEK